MGLACLPKTVLGKCVYIVYAKDGKSQDFIHPTNSWFTLVILSKSVRSISENLETIKNIYQLIAIYS
jgi:hypothetical protein